MSLFLLVLIHLQQNFAQSLQNDVITLVRNFNRPSVMFSQSQISKNSQSKYCHCQTFYKLIPLSLFSSVVVILNTRLAVILKFLYLCCYSVLITKQFNWLAGEAQYFDCENICACAQQLPIYIYINSTNFTYDFWKDKLEEVSIDSLHGNKNWYRCLAASVSQVHTLLFMSDDFCAENWK